MGHVVVIKDRLLIVMLPVTLITNANREKEGLSLKIITTMPPHAIGLHCSASTIFDLKLSQ
ncbi:hypothetical protein KY46_02850 [Photobacterium halotolerans]|uniref:Uncharacterized protein n=1 Tax=Photobacterium halotolerans TaxID=265726 RepID=A0A0F5VHT8_9GAMM|nr:hypothetical protein KY46_02850 [Photobacterium halotolerans]